MPYQEKPQFPQIEQANPGEKVVLEGVKVTIMFDLAQGNGWTRQDMKVELNGHETKVKQWRPERVLNVGDTVTVVGMVEEYQGKKSLSVDAKKGGGIAAEGEPLHTVEPTQAPAKMAARSTQGAAPAIKPNITDFRDGLAKGIAHWVGYFADDVQSGTLEYGEAVRNARALAISETIAILRGDIENSELPF